jgi:thiol-disulfide isomerase/thioredoxin
MKQRSCILAVRKGQKSFHFLRTLYFRACFIGFTIVIASAVLSPSSWAAPTATSPTDKSRSLRIQVLDKKMRMPLPGVKLDLHFGGRSLGSRTTDSQGMVEIVFPDGSPDELRVSLSKEGYVSARAVKNRQDLARMFSQESTPAMDVAEIARGRAVIGKIVLPPDAEMKPEWLYGDYRIWKKEKQKQPADLEKAGQRRFYPFTVNPDGTFRSEELPAGVYTLEVELNSPPRFGEHGLGEPIGTIVHELTISEVPGGLDAGPLNLGTLTLTMKTIARVGGIAPDFEVQTLDGKTIRLRDYRGRYVLLDFWGTWCGPCVGELPHLKAIYKKFGGNKHFVMISLSLDDSRDELRSFIRKNAIPWPQGVLGEWSKSQVPVHYGVEAIPAIFLIGPDAKVLRKDLRGPAIEAAVQRALKKTAR